MNRSPLPRDKPLVVGKEFRFAPARDRKQACTTWKFWISGREVYATSRSSGDLTRVSVHESGRVHMHMGDRDVQGLAPLLALGDGSWLHAVELRFLLSADAHRPPTEVLKGKKAFLLDVPSETMLVMNLLVGQYPTSASSPFPAELTSPEAPLWFATLTDGRPIALLARILPLDQSNRDQVTFIRRTLAPRANLSSPPPEPPYVEVRQVSWSPQGGNVIVVVPMGAESHRVHRQPDSSPTEVELGRRTIRITVPTVSFPLTAPNGAVVGELSFLGCESEAILVKDVPTKASFGSLSLSLKPENLLLGESFLRPSVNCRCVPILDGAQPKNWEYTATTRFDGEILSVEIKTLSTSLRNANLATPISILESKEAILCVAPVGGVTLRVTRDSPKTTSLLEASLLLHDH